jgi:hypothetical protein
VSHAEGRHDQDRIGQWPAPRTPATLPSRNVRRFICAHTLPSPSTRRLGIGRDEVGVGLPADGCRVEDGRPCSSSGTRRGPVDGADPTAVHSVIHRHQRPVQCGRYRRPMILEERIAQRLHQVLDMPAATGVMRPEADRGLCVDGPDSPTIVPTVEDVARVAAPAASGQ